LKVFAYLLAFFSNGGFYGFDYFYSIVLGGGGGYKELVKAFYNGCYL